MRESKLLLIFFSTILALGCDGCDFGENPLGPSGFGDGNIKYYGYYFVEDEAKHLYHLDEVRSFTNIINMRYDNGANNEWDRAIAARIRASGVKVMLQIPFGHERDQSSFADQTARNKYLHKVKADMVATNFISSIAYIAVGEEWYTNLEHDDGPFSSWPIFAGKTDQQRFATAKPYLETIIDEVHSVFPDIPTVIVESVGPDRQPWPLPPNNLDVMGIDAYYIPDDPSCDEVQRAKFEIEVIPWYEFAKAQGKPIMIVAPSFTAKSWKMLSGCQMQWYADLALSGKYNIESLLWFLYNYDTKDIVGVRDSPELIDYQKNIACQLINKCPN